MTEKENLNAKILFLICIINISPCSTVHKVFFLFDTHIKSVIFKSFPIKLLTANQDVHVLTLNYKLYFAIYA